MTARTEALADDLDEDNDEGGVGDASGWIDSLVAEDDGPLGGMSPPGAAAAGAPAAHQSYPPWFLNVPGYTPKQLGEMVWSNTLPPHLAQLLQQRQALYLAEQQRVMQQQHALQMAMQQQQQHTTQSSPMPPHPTHLLQSLQEREREDRELFDRHHHTNLVFWKRNFKHLSADEIDNLISQQRSMLKHSTYAEDYYYQETGARLYPHAPPPRNVPPLMGIHRPVCLEPLDHPARPEGDMFVGVLGKIPFASLKSPKPLVVLEDVPHGQLNATTSRAIQALERGVGTHKALLSVIEDGLVLALHLADMAAVVAQLPHSERAPFVTKQQQIVASIVFILNVFVLRRPGGSYFGQVVAVGKGRLLVARCLKVMPGDQKLALLLVCLAHAHTLTASATAGEEDVLVQAISSECATLFVGPAVSGVVAVSQEFTRIELFTAFAVSPVGARLLGQLLHSVLLALSEGQAGPPQWPAIFQGLMDAVLPVVPELAAQALAVSTPTPALRLLVALAGLASPAQRLLLVNAVGSLQGRTGPSADGLRAALG